MNTLPTSRDIHALAARYIKVGRILEQAAVELNDSAVESKPATKRVVSETRRVTKNYGPGGLTKLIESYIEQKGPSTTAEIALAVGAPYGSVSTTLRQGSDRFVQNGKKWNVLVGSIETAKV